jgi:predicted lipoprotein with Yx(FWY)xxD motif
MRKLIVLALLVPLLAAASGCNDGMSPADSSPAPAKAKSAASRTKRAGPTTTVRVMRTRYGRMLVDGSGRAVYLFTREATTKSRCYGACAQAWPVFFAHGRVRAGSGADAGLVGTTTRRDGRRQVTYDGHPLYYYVTDRAPGQVTCQNVAEYGGTWLVVAPGGGAIR